MNEQVKKYLTTNAGRTLMGDHFLTEKGVWQIYGEDPNCDYNGSHVQPLLDTVSGSLDDVIEYAISLPRFYTWGGGGNIKPIVIKDVGVALEARQMQARITSKIEELQAQLKEIS